MSKFWKYAESRRKYLKEMLAFYRRKHDEDNMRRIEREMDDLEERCARASQRQAWGV